MRKFIISRARWRSPKLLTHPLHFVSSSRLALQEHVLEYKYIERDISANSRPDASDILIVARPLLPVHSLQFQRSFQGRLAFLWVICFWYFDSVDMNDGNFVMLLCRIIQIISWTVGAGATEGTRESRRKVTGSRPVRDRQRPLQTISDNVRTVISFHSSLCSRQSGLWLSVRDFNCGTLTTSPSSCLSTWSQ